MATKCFPEKDEIVALTLLSRASLSYKDLQWLTQDQIPRLLLSDLICPACSYSFPELIAMEIAEKESWNFKTKY